MPFVCFTTECNGLHNLYNLSLFSMQCNLSTRNMKTVIVGAMTFTPCNQMGQQTIQTVCSGATVTVIVQVLLLGLTDAT